MKVLIHIIRCLVGVTFIYSGISKLYPVEIFELFIFDQNIIPFSWSTVFARLIIGTEVFLGIILFLNVYTKFFLRIILILLIIFTIFLSYLAIFKTDVTNCNCFGENLAFTPIESIFKNLIITALTILLIYKNKSFRIPYKKLIVIVLLAASFALPFILNPPDPFVINFREEDTGYQFDFVKLGELNYKGDQISYSDKKVVVCFFSMTCKYCKLSAQKIAIMLKNNHINSEIFYAFVGEGKDIEQFWKEGKTPVMNYKILPPDTFFSLSGLSLPAIYYIDKGIVVKKVGYRNLFESEFVEFFNE
jgi:uncharacterized membrane protein YphA (DoxX/SURF4 family)